MCLGVSLLELGLGWGCGHYRRIDKIKAVDLFFFASPKNDLCWDVDAIILFFFRRCNLNA